LAGCAFSLFINLTRYYQNVKDAPAKSRELRDELDTLIELLQDIRQTFETTTPIVQLPASFHTEFRNMHCLIYDLYEQSAPKTVEGIRRLKWPFSKEKNLETLERIGRFKGSLNARLNTLQLYPSTPIFKASFISVDEG
jgi:hypothetical protein